MIISEIVIPRTSQKDVEKMKNINANVKQAMATGDADAGFKAGMELGDILMDKVLPDMLQVITKMVNELEVACKKYANDPRWAQACKELPKVKADLKAQRMATYGQGQGRQDVGEEDISEQELDVMSADDKEVVLKDPKSGIETKIPRDPTKPGMIQKDPSDATGKRFVIDAGATGEVDKGIQPGAKVIMKQPM